MLPLLEIYGHKLRRNTFRVYWELNSTTNAKTYYRVEGRILFSEVLLEHRESSGRSIPKKPVVKLIVHHQGIERFRVVVQHRLEADPPSKLSVSNAEDAMWSSKVLDQRSCIELIAWIDDYAQALSEKHLSVGLALPFLLRQALMNHGFPVDGVVEYPAVW